MFDLAERLEVIVTETETLTRGRIFGPRLERRLRTSIETILKCAEWNLRCQQALEPAWLEEQEKQAGDTSRIRNSRRNRMVALEAAGFYRGFYRQVPIATARE